MGSARSDSLIVFCIAISVTLIVVEAEKAPKSISAACTSRLVSVKELTMHPIAGIERDR